VLELGVPGYTFEFWNGIFAPARTPMTAVNAIHQAMTQALQTPEVRERMVQLGFTVGGEPPTEFTRFFRAEVEKFRKQIIESGVPLL
jgi:tripartite-type tricarboxylate transporter receptor subunit TctC